MKKLLRLLVFICVAGVLPSSAWCAERQDIGVPANRDISLQRLKNRIDLARDKVATLKSDLSKTGSAKISREEQAKRVAEIKAETKSIREDTDKLGTAGLITSSYVHRFHSDLDATDKDLSALTPKSVAAVPEAKTEKVVADKPGRDDAGVIQKKIDSLTTRVAELKTPQSRPGAEKPGKDKMTKLSQDLKADIETVQSDIVQGLSRGTIASAHGQHLLSELTKVSGDLSSLTQPAPTPQPAARLDKETTEKRGKKSPAVEQMTSRTKTVREKLAALKVERNRPLAERMGKQEALRATDELKSEIEAIRTDIQKQVAAGTFPKGLQRILEADLDAMREELLALWRPATPAN